MRDRQSLKPSRPVNIEVDPLHNFSKITHRAWLRVIKRTPAIKENRTARPSGSPQPLPVQHLAVSRKATFAFDH